MTITRKARLLPLMSSWHVGVSLCHHQVTAAQADGKHVVHPDWLMACKYQWSRTDEQAYAMPDYITKEGQHASSSGRSRPLAVAGRHSSGGAAGSSSNPQQTGAASHLEIARKAAGRVL